VLKSVCATNQPVVITQRGRAAVVMISVEAYERAEYQRRLLLQLAAAKRRSPKGSVSTSTRFFQKRMTSSRPIDRESAIAPFERPASRAVLCSVPICKKNSRSVAVPLAGTCNRHSIPSTSPAPRAKYWRQCGFMAPCPIMLRSSSVVPLYRFTRLPWPRMLTSLARRANPLLRDILRDMRYYWVTDQAEYSTDILFRDRPSLRSLYDELLKYATQNFGAEDVMTFLGKKLDGRFKGEVITDYKKRWPGARIKHRVKQNWIKMYDKHALVLRVETVINRPYDFKILRHGKREGRMQLGWYPMAKGVSNLYRYAEVSLAANERYLEALAPVEDTRRARESIAKISTSVRKNGRPYRGFNPASIADVALFAAVLRGEHAILGFRNIDIRMRLFQAQDDPVVHRRHSAAVSRLLKRLQMHGLIAKIPRSRRWRPTAYGSQVMGTILTLHYDQYPKCFTEQAA
jgi:prevent-host-death family protein